MSLPANLALVAAISQNNQPGNCLLLSETLSGTGTVYPSQNGGYARAILLEGSGTVTLTLAGSTATDSFGGLATGVWHPMAVTSVVVSSGTTTITTATGIHFGY